MDEPTEYVVSAEALAKLDPETQVALQPAALVEAELEAELEPAASGEIWYKPQRVLRTIVQVIVGAATVLAAFALIAPQVLAAVADVLPASWVAWASGAIAAVAAVAAALARVMAIPAVDAWLTTLGLGSAPRSTTTN